MKKKLLIFCMLMLGIGYLPGKVFAQDCPGTSGGSLGSIDAGTATIDGGITAPIIINPPSYVSNVKRNNGNGTTAGYAETRLSFSDKNDHPVTLIGITNLDGSSLPKGSFVVMDEVGNFVRGYKSYALNFNIPPKNKLLFHFSCNGNYFCIPEL